MTGKEYGKKREQYLEKLGITDSDFEASGRVQRYFYILDAFIWCDENGVECTDELAESMADYVGFKHDSTMSYWDNFEAAYNALKEA